MNIEMLTEKYIKLRDLKSTVEEQHKEELAPIKAGMLKIEGLLMQQLEAAGVKSAKTPHGTPYISNVTSYKVVDFDSVLPVMMQHPELIEKKVNKSAAAALMEETKEPIAGVVSTTITKLNCRRG